MKFMILFFCAVMNCSLVLGRVLIVNNNSGALSQYTTLQQAYDNALDKDTIYLVPSPTSYGNLTPNGAIKKLTIFGNGYFLGQNPEPFTKANAMSSKTGKIIVDAGMSGSVICSLEIQGTVGSYTTDGGIMINDASNITIKRNKIQSVQIGNLVYINLSGSCNNIDICQNWISVINTGYNPRGISISGASNNVWIHNNYINLWTNSTGTYLFYFSSNSHSNVSVFNNVLSGNVYAPNTTFYNNIFKGLITGGTAGTYIGSVGSFYNNILESNQVTATNGNQINVNMSNVFVGGSSSDGQFQLKAGSPALGTGYGGVDCGMFAGITPYVLSGIPPIPGIYSAMVPTMVNSSTNTLNVTIKIKANN